MQNSADLVHPVGDRSLFYLPSPKLLVTSVTPPHLDYVRSLGYVIQSFSPRRPSPSLCQDLITDQELSHALLAAIDRDAPLEIVPYGNTAEFFQMVAHYQTQYALTIALPESPVASLGWFRDALDGKSVFAMLAPALLEGTACRLAPRVVADSIPQATAAVQTFLAQAQACVVKPDVGYLSLGLMRFDPHDSWTQATIEAHLRRNAAFGHRKLSVEAWIRSGIEGQSPSVEVFVPHRGKPYVTYVCDQVFSADNLFAGIALRPEFYATAWAKTLSQGALAVADRLQSLGYCGYFDLDAIVDSEGQVYVIEMNPRRTGGTHVHDLAEFLVGQDYCNREVLLSGSLTLKHPCTWPELEIVLRESGLLYPQGAVIPVQTSSLPLGWLGYVILAAEWEAVQGWQKRLLALLT
ncbi:ATP-grasp domain-containing protein [Leptolyngbya sp. BL0902]|uniref:ATP-grasp domain-containing protein n=1 Tax=Leptolyngbya sp. BL0902 TaxID=1115757 RepID=UPI0018E7ADE6|nr:ATP-grasp domain-containing protein [Leptolyngbya sp. BL0902]